MLWILLGLAWWQLMHAMYSVFVLGIAGRRCANARAELESEVRSEKMLFITSFIVGIGDRLFRLLLCNS